MRKTSDESGGPAISSALIQRAPLHAQADASAKLREQLKATLLQLRTAQTESANAKAAQAVADAKIKELEDQNKQLEARVASLGKEAAEIRASSGETAIRLNETIAGRDKLIAQYQQGLAEWKAGYDKAAAVARQKEEERAALASEAVALRNTVADRERKNIGLFNTSMEILGRFEKFSLGKAISAREPFIQSSRVKVETLVEGYKSDILDNRIAAPAKKP
jgi:chromosome segregation ATPase